MTSPRSFFRGCGWLLLGAGWLLVATGASAQQQERKLIDRIMRPDMDLHAEGFGKAFVPAVGNPEKKSFVTRIFGGSRGAITKAGDGAFHTSGFIARKDGFATTNFTTRKLPQAGREAAVGDQTFGTKTMPVREDLAAVKTARIHEFAHSDSTFVPQGKRQDDIDDLRRQKNLSIDQVREILNPTKY